MLSYFTSEERRGSAGFDQVTLRQSFGHPGEGTAAVLHLVERARDDRDGFVLRGLTADSCRETGHTMHGHKHIQNIPISHVHAATASAAECINLKIGGLF